MISAPRGAKFSQFDIETPMKEFRRGDEVLGDTVACDCEALR
jgi:hypothetical protein